MTFKKTQLIVSIIATMTCGGSYAGNVIDSNQTGTNVTGTFSQMTTTDNSIVVSQDGSDMTATITQSNGSGSSASLIQTGNGNSSITDQQGTGQTVTLTQNGSNDQISTESVVMGTRSMQPRQAPIMQWISTSWVVATMRLM